MFVNLVLKLGRKKKEESQKLFAPVHFMTLVIYLFIYLFIELIIMHPEK